MARLRSVYLTLMLSVCHVGASTLPTLDLTSDLAVLTPTAYYARGVQGRIGEDLDCSALLCRYTPATHLLSLYDVACTAPRGIFSARWGTVRCGWLRGRTASNYDENDGHGEQSSVVQAKALSHFETKCHHGSYTGCVGCAVPHWALEAREIVIVGDRAQLSSVWLSCAGMRLLYLPWYRFSLSGKPLPGPSIPRISFDSLLGFGIRETMTWYSAGRVIASEAEATETNNSACIQQVSSTVDWRSRRGVVLSTTLECVDAGVTATYGTDRAGAVSFYTGERMRSHAYWIAGAGSWQNVASQVSAAYLIDSGSDKRVLEKFFMASPQWDTYSLSRATVRWRGDASVGAASFGIENAHRQTLVPEAEYTARLASLSLSDREACPVVGTYGREHYHLFSFPRLTGALAGSTYLSRGLCTYSIEGKGELWGVVAESEERTIPSLGESSGIDGSRVYKKGESFGCLCRLQAAGAHELCAGPFLVRTALAPQVRLVASSVGGALSGGVGAESMARFYGAVGEHDITCTATCFTKPLFASEYVRGIGVGDATLSVDSLSRGYRSGALLEVCCMRSVEQGEYSCALSYEPTFGGVSDSADSREPLFQYGVGRAPRVLDHFVRGVCEVTFRPLSSVLSPRQVAGVICGNDDRDTGCVASLRGSTVWDAARGTQVMSEAQGEVAVREKGAGHCSFRIYGTPGCGGAIPPSVDNEIEEGAVVTFDSLLARGSCAECVVGGSWNVVSRLRVAGEICWMWDRNGGAFTVPSGGRSPLVKYEGRLAYEGHCWSLSIGYARERFLRYGAPLHEYTITLGFTLKGLTAFEPKIHRWAAE